MNICVSLSGYTEQALNEAVRRGIARTKAEALRIAVLRMAEHYHLVSMEIETEKISAKEATAIRKTLREMEAGKEHSFEEVFGRS